MDNSNIALEKLRQLIIEYQRHGKTNLPSRAELVSRFGVGQRAIRRALKVLEFEGLIFIRNGSGAYISVPFPAGFSLKNIPEFTNILEVMKVRIFLEPELAKLAAVNISDYSIDRMKHAQSQLLQSSDLDSSELWDGTFHREIALNCKNKLLLTLFDQINLIRQSEQWRNVRQSIRDDNFLEENHKDHNEILKALLAKDGLAAKAAMQAHLSRLTNTLTLEAPEKAHERATS